MNITKTHDRVTTRLFAVLTVLSLLLSAFPAFVFEANAEAPAAGGGGGVAVEEKKVTICHATESQENPWNRVVVSKNAIGGHFENNGTPKSGHEDDLLFEGEVDCPAPVLPETAWLEITKSLNAADFEGDLDEADFSFNITGNGVNETISHGGVVELPVGTYDVTESYTGNDPIGFDPEDWTVYWAGDICEGSADAPATEPGTLVVEEDDIGKYVENNPGKCSAENQYKPVVDENDTTEVIIEKKLSGPYPEGSLASDFTFDVESIGVPVVVSGGTDDYASAIIELGVGTYLIEEIMPEGYVPANWTTQWSGPACENIGNALGTTIVVEEGDIGKDNFSCRADNVYESDTPETCDDPLALNYGDEGQCEYDENATSAVTVIKELVGTTTSPTQFSFRLNEGPSIGFEEDGDNVIEVPAGDYTIEEVAATGYTITYSDGCSGTIGVGEDRTCTITNTWPDDNGGGGQCEAEAPGWADAHQNVNQGTQKSGAAVLVGRSDADKALGPADWSVGESDGFFSLGFGGSLELIFDKFVPDEEGDDISIHEATNGGDYPLESAMVEVSQNGTDWETLTEEARNNANEDGASVTLLDFSETGLAWIKYVRITDTTDPDLHNAEADGFDLDAVDAIKEVCDEPDNDNGGGNGDEDTYRVEGYVWHDNNENTEWDGFQDEEATTTEEAQSGWTVKITDGTTTHSTTTDANGCYYFDVPAGTWTISETVMDGWDLITPADNKHVVTVPATTTAQTLGERIFAFFVPTAHAAVLETYGLFNFGNNESETVVPNGGGSSSGGGGGGSSRPRCSAFDIAGSGVAYTLSWETRNGSDLSITQDGTEIFSTGDDDVVDEGDILVTTNDADFELTVSRGSREDTCVIEAEDDGNGGGGPDGEVLGEQVSVVPLGAADAGAGGAAPMQRHSFVQTLLTFLRDRFSLTGNAK